MADISNPTTKRSRQRVARGQDRPTYLSSPDLDRVFIMLTALMAEVSALQDRVDTHEALAEAGQVSTREAVEAFELDWPRREARDARRDAMLDRVLRVLYEEREALDAPPVRS